MSDPPPDVSLRAAVGDYVRRRATGVAESLPDFVSATGFAREIVDELIQQLENGDQEADAPRDFGRFELLELLGRGGMGTVHVAHDRQLDRLVALKRIRPELLASPDARRRFEKEIKAAAGLDHPNICKIFDGGEHEGCPFLVMQHVRGATLAAKVKAAQRATAAGDKAAAIPTNDCLEWIEKVARGLHHAHEHGLVHRDVKPSNILIREDGEPFLLDFGIARPLLNHEPLTTVGVAAGTLRYMAPEQLQPGRRQLDGRADVFSLGMVLAELLTLRHPFAAESELECANAILRAEPQLGERRGHSTFVGVVLRKALAKDSDQRYATAAAFADDLGHLRNFEPIAAGACHRTDRARLWVRRHRLLVTSALALATIALIVAFVVHATMVTAREAAQTAQLLAKQVAALEPGALPEQALTAAVEVARLQRTASIDALLFGGLEACGKAYTISRRSDQHGGVMTSPALDARGERMAFLTETGKLLVFRIADGATLCDLQAHDAQGAGAAVQSVAFHPNREHLFTGGRDGRIKVWDTTNWSQLDSEGLANTGEKAPIASLAVSADGGLLAVGGDRGEVLLKDLRAARETGTRRLSASTSEKIAGLRLSPDARHLLMLLRTPDQHFGEFLGMSLLDCGSGAVRWTRRFDAAALMSCEWHPSGRWVVAGNLRGEVLVMDTEADAATVCERRFSDKDRHVRWCGFDPSGQHLLIGTAPGIVVLDWADGKAGRQVTVAHTHERPLASLCFNRAGGCAAALFRDGSLSLIDGRDWRVLESFASPEFATSNISVRWAEGAGRIVAGRNDGIDVWHAPPQAVVPAFYVHRQAVHSVDLHPDGETVLTGSADGTVAETALRTGESRQIVVGAPVDSARYSRDGELFLVVDTCGNLRVYGRQALAPILEVPGTLGLWIDEDRFLAAKDNLAAVVRVSDGSRTDLHEHTGRIMAAAFDAKHVFTGGADRVVWMSDLADPRVHAPFSTAALGDLDHGSLMGCVGSLAPLPGKEILLVSMINVTLSVVGYDHGGRAPGRVDYDRDCFGGMIAVDPTGRFAVVSDFGFGRISWLDLERFKTVAPITSATHTQMVTAIRFSRTGKLCLTASLDGTVKIWDSATQTVRSILRLGDTTIHDACFTADETRFLTGDGRGQVKSWPVDPLPAAEQYLRAMQKPPR